MFRLNAAGKARVPVIDLVVRLQARDLDVLSVDHDDVVACVKKWGVLWIVFAREDTRHSACQPAERLAGSIDNKPLARNFPLGEIG